MLKKMSKHHYFVTTYDRGIIKNHWIGLLKNFLYLIYVGQTDSFCPNTKSKMSFSVTKWKFQIIAAAINRDIMVM